MMSQMDFSTSRSANDMKGIWNNKNSDDFMRYLKFEIFAFGFVMSHLLMGIFLLYRFYRYSLAK